jgi:amidase
VNGEGVAFASIREQRDLLSTGTISCEELLDLYLERCERLEPTLNAFRVVYADEARAAARAAQRHIRDGRDAPLLGLPVAVKDEFDVAGDITAMGTAAYGGPARRDAEVVRRLRRAGAIVLGKTHVPELSAWPVTESPTWSATRNPWDPRRSPGGSSGGSAAAVAGGLATVAIGSDGAGSIRIPAAWCGLHGLKCRTGRMPYLPPHWYGLSVVGPLTRTAADCALLYDVLTTRDIRSSAPTGTRRTRLRSLRIAVTTAVPAPIEAEVDSEVLRAVELVAERLRGFGHHVVSRDPAYGPVWLANWLSRYLRGIHDDAAAMAFPERLDASTRQLAAWGAAVRHAEAARARDEAPGIRAAICESAGDPDVILMPAVARAAPLTGELIGEDAAATLQAGSAWVPFTAIWNVTDQPALSVPAGFNRSGLPLSAQLVGCAADERILLRLASQLEDELDRCSDREQAKIGFATPPPDRS